MNTVMLDNPNPSKPEIPSSNSEGGGQAAEVTVQTGVIASGTAPAAVPPQPPKLSVGALGKVEELPSDEYLALLTQEEILGDEFKNSINVGLALLEIRDRRLYRMDYLTFDEYYQKKWHFEKRRVYFLTATAEVYRSITTATNLPIPGCAFEMRPLLGLTRDQVRLAWEQAANRARGGKITQRLVRAAVVELQFKPERNADRLKVRGERAERRQQLSQAMDDLLELIVTRKPYEELVEKASLLDQQVRFFFPKRPTSP
jgi:hypothetical protein